MNFSNSEIVVWNGIVTRFQYIKNLLGTGDRLRYATNGELNHYLDVQQRC